MDILSYALSRKYVESTAIGLGAVRGKNCTVSNIVEEDDKATLTFKWTGDDGTVQTRNMVVKNGISVTSIDIDEATNRLTCTLSDGTIRDCGTVNVVADVTKIAYTNADEPTVTNVKTALDTLFKNCTDTIGEDFSPDVSTGSVKDFYPANTTLADIIKDMLTVKDPPQLNLSINPSRILYDIVSESVTSLTINATIVKKTNEINRVEFYVNGALKHTVTSGVANGGTVPYIYNTEIKETTTIKVVVTDSEGLSATSTKKIEFYPVIYYGILDANTSTVTEQMIKTLNTKLQNTKVFTYENITTDWGKVCVCVPKMLGDVTSIFDPINNLSYNSTFETSTVSCNGYDYTVLKQIDASAASGITLKFS